jgi:hypothetical protein
MAPVSTKNFKLNFAEIRRIGVRFPTGSPQASPLSVSSGNCDAHLATAPGPIAVLI